MNDLNVRALLNPLTDLADLSFKTRRSCYRDMLDLLRRLIAKFRDADTRVIVTVCPGAIY
jgi:hypothetical protein